MLKILEGVVDLEEKMMTTKKDKNRAEENLIENLWHG